MVFGLGAIPLSAHASLEERLNSQIREALELMYVNPDSALVLSNQLLKEVNTSVSALSRANLYSVRGNIFHSLHSYDSAMHYHFRAYQIRKESKDLKSVAASEYNIGINFYTISQFQKAKDYFHKSLVHRIQVSDSFGVALSFNSLGLVYQELGQLDSVVPTLQRGLLFFSDNADDGDWLKCDIYCNLAKYYEEMDSLAKAEEHLKLALDINQAYADDFQKAWIYHHLGIVAEYQAKYESAALHYDSAYQIATKLQAIDQLWEIERSYLNLFLKSIGNDTVIELFDRFIIHGDSLQSERQKETINRLETEFQVAQKEQALRLKTLENQSQKRQIAWLVALILLVLILSFFILRYYRKRKQVSELGLSLKKKELDDLLRKQEIERVNALLKGQNKERQRIAQELHDRLGSLLLAAKLQYQKLEKQLQKALEEQHKSQDQLNNLLQEATEEVRRISHDLYEGSLAQFGYATAIKQLIEAVEAANPIQIHFEENDVSPSIYKAFETDVYRISQELLSNTLKYANAGKIEIIFSILEGQFIFQYRDNGKGFNLNQLEQGAGIGFKNIQDRVARIGGTMELSTKPGKGMQFQLKVEASHGGNKNDFSG